MVARSPDVAAAGRTPTASLHGMPPNAERGCPPTDGSQCSVDDSSGALAFFDELMMQRVDLDTLVRRTAERIAGRAGIDSADGRHFSASPQAVGPTSVLLRRAVPNGHVVWLETSSTAEESPKLFLDRFAVAAAVALSQLDSWSNASGDAAIDGILSESVARVDRSRLLRAVGLSNDARIRLIAAAGPQQARVALVEQLAGTAQWSRYMDLGDLTALLISMPCPRGTQSVGRGT
jgi:hypothetical protein